MSMKEVIAVAAIAVIAVLAVSFIVDNQDDHKDPVVSDRIGIIGAMDEEVSLIKQTMSIDYTTNYAGMKFFVGTLSDKDVVVVQSGMGKVNSGICAEILATQFNVSYIINTGVAGALCPELGIGDIVVSTDAVQHDFDVSPIGYHRGEIPYTGLYSFEADKDMRAKAMEIIPDIATDHKVMEGRICTGDQFIASEAQKKTITDNFGGLCCEMEGGSIAQVCYLNDIPFLIIRAISDNADESGDYDKYKREIATNLASIVTTFVLEF